MIYPVAIRRIDDATVTHDAERARLCDAVVAARYDPLQILRVPLTVVIGQSC